MNKQIAFVNADNGLGGASRAVCRLIRGLDSSSISQFKYSLLAYGNAEPGYELLPPRRSSNPLIKSIQSRSLLLSSCRAWLTNRWEKKSLSKEAKHQFYRSGTELDFSVDESLKSFDMAHFFWCQAYLHLSNAMLFKGPIVITLHDMWFLTGGCTYNLSCQKFISGCAQCPDIKLKAQDEIQSQFKLKRRLLNRSDCQIIVTSRWMQRQACESGLNPEKITIIPNYIPKNYCYLSSKHEFRRLLGWKKFAASERVILYFVGSLTDPRKGFSLLVDALKLLPDSTLRSLDLQVLGSPYPKIDVLEEIGISYISLGFLRDEFSQIVAYNAADFLVCPSYFDNSPNVVAEALCCGLPAIALPDTGGAEMLIHGVNGLIPESQAPSSLAELLFYMVAGAYSFDRPSISSTARKTFGYPATCQKHENLYGKLL